VVYSLIRQLFLFRYGIKKKKTERRKAMEEYILLFNKISDAIEKLEELKQELISAQQKAEEIFIEK
jgi:hypothetical protein